MAAIIPPGARRRQPGVIPTCPPVVHNRTLSSRFLAAGNIKNRRRMIRRGVRKTISPNLGKAFGVWIMRE
jgi:hypothetical protein